MEQINSILKGKYGFPSDIISVLKKDGIRAMGKYCEEKLIHSGKIFNECYGWEKPSVLESFGLDPNMKAIPAQYYKEFEFKGISIPKKDAFGKKTGEYETTSEKIWTGKWKLGATENFMAYYDWKNTKLKQQMAENYSSIN